MHDTQSIIDVSHATFEQAVIAASHERPVVVDFWAPWCGPCRQLGPLLERLATAANGTWTLARINVDENPALAQRYGVQGIPAVKGFRDGRVAGEFVGAQPEGAIRRFLERLLPTAADRAAIEGERLAVGGHRVAAEATFQRALEQQADHPQALLGLGRLFAEDGRDAEALALLERIPVATASGREAAPLLARLRLVTAASAGPEVAAAQERLVTDPRDPEAHLVLGRYHAAQGDYAEALEHLLTVVQRDKSYRDGAARRAMVEIFEALGPDDTLTIDYRRKLASALY